MISLVIQKIDTNKQNKQRIIQIVFQGAVGGADNTKIRL